MNGYAKSTIEVLRSCEKALRAIQSCQACGGAKCAPNDSDFDLVRAAMSDIYEFCELRDLKI